MNYPVWPDSEAAGATSYPRGASAVTAPSSGGNNARPLPPSSASEDSKAKYVHNNGHAAGSARMSNGEDCVARGQQQQSVDKYAALSSAAAATSFPDDDSLLKVAAHFLSGAVNNAQGRHYVPVARDYSTLSAVPVSGSAAYCNSGQQLIQDRLSATRSSEGTSRMPFATNSESGSAATVGGAPSGNQATAGNNLLLSPCSVMEEASSPGSTTSQLSYLGPLQNPATSSFNPLGFPNPYLLTKDGAGLAAAAAAAAAQAAHAAQQHQHAVSHFGHVGVGGGGGSGPKRKEPKPGSDVRSFGCQVCGRGFRQKATLAQHERTHTDERPFDCPDCHKRFRQQSHLVQHLRIHSDERPYSCTYCEKAFRQKAILNQHIRIHTGEKPYVCPQCTKCFRQKAILNQHIRTHSGKRPYSCPDSKCKKKFVDQVSMEKHFKKHIEDDQNQLLTEARAEGATVGTGIGGLGGLALGGSGAVPMRGPNAGRSDNNAKGLLRVKLDHSERPASFGRTLDPTALGSITTQDRATSPFPINMMIRTGPGPIHDNPSAASSSPLRQNPMAHESSSSQQQQEHQHGMPPGYLSHHHPHHHQAAAAAAAAAASGPYQFVPFPHRPYPYDLLGLGSVSQSMYGGNKVTETVTKYRSDSLGEASQATRNNTVTGPTNEMADGNNKDCNNAGTADGSSYNAVNGPSKSGSIS